MNGHLPLIDLRKQGYKPEAVFVIDGDCDHPNDWHRPRYTRTGPLIAEVRIAANDNPQTLDLRWAVGLQIHLSAWRSLERGKRLHAALIAAKPKQVLTAVTLGELYRPHTKELFIHKTETTA